MLNYQTRPLQDRAWLRPSYERVTSRFTAKWSDTLILLERELDALQATDIVIGVDLRVDQIRRDGMPKANASASSPAAELAFESKQGPLTYQCDTYGSLPWRPGMQQLWQHNLRAIAMTLEAQRAVLRHGAAREEQVYRGWAAIEAPGKSDSSAAAAEFLRSFGHIGDSLESCLRNARKKHHPDVGGTKDMWERIDVAGRTLGLIR